MHPSQAARHQQFMKYYTLDSGNKAVDGSGEQEGSVLCPFHRKRN